jgi:hypothetical protein
VRPRHGGIGVAEGGELGAEAVAVAVAAAEDGVDEAALRAETGLAGEGDGFVDGGVGRDAVEKEELVKAQPEQVLEGGFLGAPVGTLDDQPIEGGALAQDPVNELLRQAPVGRLKAVEIGVRLEPMLEEIPG